MRGMNLLIDSLDFNKNNYIFEAITDLMIDNTVTQSKEKVKVFLSSIHKSKGLEYDDVLLIDNFQQSAELVKNSTENIDLAKAKVEEEKRIRYVAFTRAKNNILISVENLNPFQNKNTYDGKDYF